jgi:hypothetical protein
MRADSTAPGDSTHIRDSRDCTGDSSRNHPDHNSHCSSSCNVSFRQPQPESRTGRKRLRRPPSKLQRNVLSYTIEHALPPGVFENLAIFYEFFGEGSGEQRLEPLRRKLQAIASCRRSFRSEIATRSCFMLSRWRKVTVSFFAGPFSPMVSKSTVTPKGVPASSWRR